MEDDDFMSDAILEMIEKESESFGSKKKRKREVITSSSIRNLTFESNKENLNKPISNENKGFRLLARMGYKPGMSIGQRGGGLVQPLDLILKSDRKGLGMYEQEQEQERMETLKAQEIVKKQAEEKHNIERKYHDRASTAMNERKLNQSLWEAVKVCRSLDERSGVKNTLLAQLEAYELSQMNSLKVFMEELLAEDIETRTEFFKMLLEHMRHHHRYCLFCGHQFESYEQLTAECPGMYEEDHE